MNVSLEPSGSGDVLLTHTHERDMIIVILNCWQWMTKKVKKFVFLDHFWNKCVKKKTVFCPAASSLLLSCRKWAGCKAADPKERQCRGVREVLEGPDKSGSFLNSRLHQIYSCRHSLCLCSLPVNFHLLNHTLLSFTLSCQSQLMPRFKPPPPCWPQNCSVFPPTPC